MTVKARTEYETSQYHRKCSSDALEGEVPGVSPASLLQALARIAEVVSVAAFFSAAALSVLARQLDPGPDRPGGKENFRTGVYADSANFFPTLLDRIPGPDAGLGAGSGPQVVS